jgi:hypothetical protein
VQSLECLSDFGIIKRSVQRRRQRVHGVRT